MWTVYGQCIYTLVDIVLYEPYYSGMQCIDYRQTPTELSVKHTLIYLIVN